MTITFIFIFGGDQDVVVPGNGIQHLAQRQLNALAGNADLKFRLLTTQRPPQLGGKVLEFFLLKKAI